MSILSLFTRGKPVRTDPHGVLAARRALAAMVEAKRNSPEIVAYRKNRAAQIQRRAEPA